MKKSGAFFSIQKSQIFPSTPNTYKKTSFGPLLTDIFLFLLLKGAKNVIWSAFDGLFFCFYY